MSLVETMIGAMTLVMVVGAVMVFAFYAARSFAAMTNYVDLDSKSRGTLDRMTSEIRQADALTAAATNYLTFQTTDPNSGAVHTLNYSYNADAKTVTRTYDGVASVLLTECTFWTNALCQRNATNATFGSAFAAVPTTRPDQCKVIQLTWICSRNILGKMANTESVQSAHVVIRKK